MFTTINHKFLKKVIYQRTGGAGKQPSAAIAVVYYCVRSGIAYALHEFVECDTGSFYPALGMLLAGPSIFAVVYITYSLSKITYILNPALY